MPADFMNTCVCVCVCGQERERAQIFLGQVRFEILTIMWRFGIIKIMMLFRTMRVCEIIQQLRRDDSSRQSSRLRMWLVKARWIEDQIRVTSHTFRKECISISCYLEIECDED